MRKQRPIVILCLCAILLLTLSIAVQLSFIIGTQADAMAVSPPDMSGPEQIQREVEYAQTLGVPELVAYFKHISAARGAVYAYEILRQIPPSDLDPYKHLFGHVIGDELFNEQNIQGLEVCTSEFSFACYHSLISRAIFEQGLENIAEINKRCLQLEDSGGCRHGIGHGIMAALGYEDPVAAVAVCATLAKYGTTRACVEGVIMEFNFHQLEEMAPSSFRQVDERGYYYPCTEISEKYKNECFFEQTLWWREVLGKTSYPAIGALCDAIKNDEHKVWCYRGIGRLIPEFSSDPIETMAAQCIGSTSAVDGQALCMQALRDRTKNDGSICSLLPRGYQSTCSSPIPLLVIE